MRQIGFALAIAFVLFTTPIVTLADTLTVCASGCNHTSIQDAINATVDGDTVLVSAGMYLENIDFLGKAITVQSEAGAEETVIDGNQTDSVVTFNSGETEEAIIDGFTIRNGEGDWGGGIYCYDHSSPTITNCTVIENKSTDGGGIMCYYYSSPNLTNCTIAENSAIGAMATGGGISCFDYSSPNLTNCTIAENSSEDEGGGIFSYRASVHLMNCILWNNFPDEVDGSATVTYSDVQGEYSGEGNINADPLFAGEGNYHLTIDSPCIDAGTDAGVYIDMDGDTRPDGNGFDMGADEFTPEACDNDEDGYEHPYCGGNDCDDSDANTYPGAPEICDGLDNDCDDVIPENEADLDGDEFMVCNEDCDDTDLTVYPGAEELCDGMDNDCDGQLRPDEMDEDEDRWLSCVGDCNDYDPNVNPDAKEICANEIDENCDGTPDDGGDNDGDGYTCLLDCDNYDPDVNPGAEEILDNGIDDNCDGLIDVKPPCFIGSLM